MSKWECEEPKCDATAVGNGSAAGLRAIGWFVTLGPPGIFDLRCPRHHPDANDSDKAIARQALAAAIEECGFVVSLDNADRAAERLTAALRQRGFSVYQHR